MQSLLFLPSSLPFFIFVLFWGFFTFFIFLLKHSSHEVLQKSASVKAPSGEAPIQWKRLGKCYSRKTDRLSISVCNIFMFIFYFPFLFILFSFLTTEPWIFFGSQGSCRRKALKNENNVSSLCVIRSCRSKRLGTKFAHFYVSSLCIIIFHFEFWSKRQGIKFAPFWGKVLRKGNLETRGVMRWESESKTETYQGMYRNCAK